MAEVKEWLENLHLSQYLSTFISGGYKTLSSCASLTENDLNRLNINPPGHQKRILTHLPEVTYGNISSTLSDAALDETVTLGLPYMTMDKVGIPSKQATISTPGGEYDEDIYDTPPPRDSVSAEGSTAVEYVAADAPPPLLPPKKRISTEDLDARLGIKTPIENTKFDYSNNELPPLMKILPASGDVSTVRKTPIPRPRMSVAKKKPKPLPRGEKRFSKSLKDRTNDTILEEERVKENNHKTSVVERAGSDASLNEQTYEDVNSDSEADAKRASYQTHSKSNEDFTSSSTVTAAPEGNVFEYSSVDEISTAFLSNKPQVLDENIYELDTDVPVMVSSDYSSAKEESLYEIETLPCLPIKKQTSEVESDDSELEMERIVIGADSDLTLEENENLTNELIYQDAHLKSLQTKDSERVSYAGIWDMQSVLTKNSKTTEKIASQVPNAFHKEIPPPNFLPPPLPSDYVNKKSNLLSPTLMSLPIAPSAPAVRHVTPDSNPSLPPSVPPRKTSIKTHPQTECFTDDEKLNIKSNNRESQLSFSDLALERNQSTKEDLPGMMVNTYYEKSDSSSNVDPFKRVENNDQAAMDIYSEATKEIKRAPPPPPRVNNPFKDFYNEERGTYCFETEPELLEPDYSTGWESEDTLSDGGDLYSDEEEAEKFITLGRGNLGMAGSIPIVAVNQNRIQTRKGYLHKMSSGKSGGNPIKASLRWPKRWVVYDSYSLQYFASHKSQVSKRIIPSTSIINVEQKIRQGEAHPYRFTIYTVDRAYCFAAEDQNDLTLWTSLIMSSIIESDTEEYEEGGSMCNPSMKGFVKMDGAKGKRYLAVKNDKFCYYNTYSDFVAGCPIHCVEMKIALVKDLGKQKLQLITPYVSFNFTFESNEDVMMWKEAFEEAIAEGLADNSVLSEVYENHSNRFCADCGAPDPHWASVNLGITLCKKCAGIHRSISTPTTKVRSLRMDFKVWTPALKELFKKIGNDNANNFWEWNATEDDQIDSDADMHMRKTYIEAKYLRRKFVKYDPLRNDEEALNEALCKAVQYENVVETMQLLFSGADILYNSSPTYSSNSETPFQLAKSANQPVQMEFLYHNGCEGSGQLPFRALPVAAPVDLVLPSATNISVRGYLYKTGSNVKGEFLKRWVILEHNILSYYENENKSQAKDSIQRQEMLSVTQTVGDRYEFTFELATVKDHGRIYLFAADTQDDRSMWLNSLARTIAPMPVEKLDLIKDFERGGVVYLRDGSTADYKQTWMQINGRKLYIYKEEEKDFNEIDLRKIKNLTMLQSTHRFSQCLEEGNPFVLDLPKRALYIQADIRKETEEWLKFIKKSAESGSTLSDQQLTTDNVVVIVDKCINYVETHDGIETEGIYRHSGQNSKVSQLLQSFQKDARNVHVTPEDYTIHDVTNALKRFIRSLENSLLTTELYDKWIRTATMNDINIKLEKYKRLLESLPEINYATLQKLTLHLAKIKEKEQLNKMSVVNLASIFGPVLLNTTPEADTANQGFGNTQKEIVVYKDILENYDYFYVVNTIDRKKEKAFLDAIKKMQQAENSMGEMNDMLLSVHVRTKDDPDVVLHTVSPNMTAQQILTAVMKKRNLHPSDNWGLYEIICQEELERPLHFSEKVLSVTMRWSSWPDDFRVDNHLCVKKNYVYEQINQVFDSHFSLFGELKFSEKKGFKKFCFEFSQYKLSYQKDPKSLQHLASWNVEDLTVYIGCQPKRNPPTKWAFTFITNDELHKFPGSKEGPYFGHSVCCNNQEELYRWIAAMTRARHPAGLVHEHSADLSAITHPEHTHSMSDIAEGGVSLHEHNNKKDKFKASIFKKLLNKQNR